jgi:hypothetical protein
MLICLPGEIGKAHHIPAWCQEHLKKGAIVPLHITLCRALALRNPAPDRIELFLRDVEDVSQAHELVSAVSLSQPLLNLRNVAPGVPPTIGKLFLGPSPLFAIRLHKRPKLIRIQHHPAPSAQSIPKRYTA